MKERWSRNPRDINHQIEDYTYVFILNEGESKCKGTDVNGNVLTFMSYSNILVFVNGLQHPFRTNEFVNYPGWEKDVMEQSITLVPPRTSKAEVKIRTINIV